MSAKARSRETYVALLRGINVGGKNVIKMVDLRACFEGEGFRDVDTYIQSGNVLFSASASERPGLTARIEAMLAAAFDYDTNIVVRSRRQMRAVIGRAPGSFGERPKAYRYDVIFLKEPLTAATALKTVRTKAGVDEAYPGPGVLYFSRLISKAAQSQLSRLVAMPIYQRMTIRNWNTTTKLMQRLEAPQRSGE